MPPPDSSPSVPAISTTRMQFIATAVPPWALVVVAIISVQVGAAIAKELFDAVGPSAVVLLRTVLSCLMFACLRPKVRGFRKKDYAMLTVYGITIAAMMLLFYAAISRIPIGITVTIAFAGPLGVAVAGSHRRTDLMWVGFAAVGILLLSPLTGETLDPLGLLFAVISAISWSVYILISGRVARVFPLKSGLTLSLGIAALIAFPFGATGAAKALANPGILLVGLVVAVLSSAIPFGLEFYALRKMAPREFGMLASIEPVFAALVGFIVLHEGFGVREIVGILLVTVAAAATAHNAPG